MEFIKTKLDGVILIKPDAFEDFRGSYAETYNEALYKKNGIAVNFVADDYSVSSKHVLRGLHGDDKTWKLVDCRHGMFYLVVLNVIEGSSQYGQWEGFTLSETNHSQVLIPPKFANGHLALTDKIIFNYKQSEYYDPKGQFTVRYDDPRFKIWWPIKNPILSRRDEEGKYA
jgi:dTDP-4-dehydrorhamnose 3,5-epimerase